MKIKNYAGINRTAETNRKNKPSNEIAEQKDIVTIGKPYKKPELAPYYAQKCSGDFLPETLKEFPDLGGKYKGKDAEHRGGYFMPTEDKEYLCSRERDLKGELNFIEKRLGTLKSERFIKDVTVKVLQGAKVLSGGIFAFGFFGLASPSVATALIGGGTLGFVASFLATEYIDNRLDSERDERRVSSLENKYYEARDEIDHIKKSEIFWTNRQLSPKEKCKSELNNIREKSIRKLGEDYASDYDYGYSSGGVYHASIRGEAKAAKKIDNYYKKKYPELYDDSIQHNEEYYEKLLPKIQAETGYFVK